jgi:hypothetical protein
MRRWFTLAASLALLSVELAGGRWRSEWYGPPQPEPRRPSAPLSYKTYTCPDFAVFFLMLKPSPPGGPPEFWQDHLEDGFGSTARYNRSGMYRNDGSGVPLWTVDWYATRVDPSPDGIHAVRLEPCPTGLGGEVLGFLAGGSVLRSYQLEDLIMHPKRLDHSGSYFRWLDGNRCDWGRFTYTVRTAEGRSLAFDVRSGELVTGPVFTVGFGRLPEQGACSRPAGMMALGRAEVLI